MSDKSSFRSLVEMSDKIAREELGDYYVMGASRMHNMLDCLESGAKQIQSLTEEVEHLRVQLARCGDAAMCNTLESMEQQCVDRDAYGWSASYGDVLDAVKREIKYREALKAQLELVNSNIITTWPDIAARLIAIAKEAVEYNGPGAEPPSFGRLPATWLNQRKEKIMPLRENIKTAFRECNELRGDAARLEREIAILRGALERIAQVLPGGNTLRERTCWEITQDALQDASRITCPVCENEALRKRMEMLQKSLAYYRCGLIGERPFYIPSRVRLPQMVCGEGPYQVVRAEAGDHDCTSNQYGAISVMANNGKQLGVKPSEFEPLEWVRNPKA